MLCMIVCLLNLCLHPKASQCNDILPNIQYQQQYFIVFDIVNDTSFEPFGVISGPDKKHLIWLVLTWISWSGVGGRKPSMEWVWVWQRFGYPHTALSSVEAWYPHVQQVTSHPTPWTTHDCPLFPIHQNPLETTTSKDIQTLAKSLSARSKTPRRENHWTSRCQQPLLAVLLLCVCRLVSPKERAKTKPAHKKCCTSSINPPWWWSSHALTMIITT